MNNQIIDKPEIKSIQDFLAERNTLGIYIPAYQRYFSWGQEQFIRFFEDVATDIRRDTKPQHYMTFLGSIICFDDVEKETIAPGLKPQQPERVYNIVDGQQRMLFINILSVLLHKLISSDYTRLLAENEWFRQQVEELQDNLMSIISVKISGKKTVSPKIIRAIVDEWARTESEEKLTSPSARFLDQYLKYVEGGMKRGFSYSDQGIPEDLKTKHSNFLKHVAELEKLLRNFCRQVQPKDKEIRYELASVEELVENSILMESAFPNDISEDYKEGRFDFTGPLKEKKEELFRALLLGNYVYRCVYAIIVVTRNSYDRTLTVFDALNVTGRSLNAFETFKPDVIKLGIPGYRDSDRKSYIDKIEADMNRRKNRKDVDKHVSELIVSFALANSGFKLSKDLHDQRSYLRSTFEQHAKDQGQYLEYLKFFSSVNDMKRLFETDSNGLEAFLRIYKSDIDISDNLNRHIEEATFCLRFLSKAGFTITISLLSIYLHQIHAKSFSEEAIEQFCDAVRKTAAFCAIWRSSAESTNRIDDRIRKVLGADKKGSAWQPLCRYDYKQKKALQPLELKELSRIFKALVTEMYEIQEFSKWAELVTAVPAYKMKQVARFLLLVGSNRTKVDKQQNPPCLETARPGAVPELISRYGFDHPVVKSIEHIIPQNEGEVKDSEYSKQEKHQLWNLTLVPAEVNSVLGNRDWKLKRVLYQYYSAEDKKEQKRYLGVIEQELDPEQFKRFLKNKDCGYLPMTKYLALLKGDFTKEKGEERNKAIIKNCWRVLAEEWLGW